MPIELQPTTAIEPRGTVWQLRGPARPKGLGVKERMFLTERLALLLDTGNPLHTSLGLLCRQATSDEFRHVVEALEHDVAAGLSFSEALRRQPEAFPPTYVSLVAAAERGGFLPQVLDRLREMDEKRRELRSTLSSSLSYPAFLIVFSLAVVVFILAVVFPKFSDLFKLIADELPATTVVLMAMSEGLRDHWAALLVIGGGGATAFWRWARSARGVAFLDALSYRVPLLRQFVGELNLVQFLGLMSLSLGHGVSMMDSLRACRTVVGSPRFRSFVEELETGVNEGRELGAGFRAAGFLPPLVEEMISTGEETGELPKVMARVADFYEREWRKRLTTVSKLVEPTMLLVMGVVVGLIVSSLLLPIFKLSRAVH